MVLFRALLALLAIVFDSSRNDAWSHSGRGRRGLSATLSSSPPPVASSISPLPNNAIEPGHLYYVSTPLGNLQDVTLRALHILAGVDVILAEDTRTTLKLLSLLRITPKRVLAHHEHNWQQSTPGVVQMLREGRSVALVSDAGTPGISDPGAQLAAACAALGLTVHPIPGPSAVLAALSVSGFNCVPFTFHGFVPARGRERGEVLLALLQARGVGVFFEAPHRVGSTMRALAALAPEWGERRCVVCRELTKRNEEVWRGSLREAADWLEGCAAEGAGAGAGAASASAASASASGKGAEGAEGTEGGGRLLRRAALKSGGGNGGGGIRGEFTVVVGPRGETNPFAPAAGDGTRSNAGTGTGTAAAASSAAAVDVVAPASAAAAGYSAPAQAESRSQADVRALLSALRADGVSRSEAVAVAAATLQSRGGAGGQGAASRGLRREVYKTALGMAWGPAAEGQGQGQGQGQQQGER